MISRSEGIKKFIEEHFSGSRKACAMKLGISQSTVCRIINGNSIGGAKFISKLITYCEKNDISYKSYISFNNLNEDRKLGEGNDYII